MLRRLSGRRLQAREQLVVLITGCDSGLGLRAAREASEAGLTVVAGVLDERGGQAVRERCAARPVLLDVTSDASVSRALHYVETLLAENPGYRLHAVVNNAGVMAFGEFAWQPLSMSSQQVAVNLLGTWRVTLAALPLLRRTAETTGGRPRLLTVGSHCAIQPLRTLAPYAASKCALRGWCEALRMELQPHGIGVVFFIPGSMVMNTNILAKQDDYNQTMRASFTPEQAEHLQNHFDRTAEYLGHISGTKPHDQLEDAILMRKFMNSLLDESPAPEYKHEPLRYAIYHFLFYLSPTKLRYWLVEKFLMLPKFVKKNEISFNKKLE